MAQYQLDLVLFADAAIVLWFVRLLRAYDGTPERTRDWRSSGAHPERGVA